MELEHIYKNNRQYVANYLQLKINELEKEMNDMAGLDKVAKLDTINLFNQAVNVILKSDIK